MSIEDKIQVYKHLLEEDPDVGHEERFKRKIALISHNKSNGFLLKVAGLAIIIGLSIFFTAVIYNNLLSGKNIMANFNSKPEFIEAQSYFRMRMNEKLHEIEQLPAREAEKNKLLMDFKHLDKSYYVLIKEFKANPYDDRVINALNQHYQYKLEALDRVLNKINKSTEESRI